MQPLRSRPVTEPSSPGLTLCRFGEHTCGACCWGERVGRPRLQAALRRQTRLFQKRFRAPRLPNRVQLLLHELASHRGADLILALLLLLPLIGDWLRARWKARMICAFLGFEDEQERRIGCMLHPSRWRGRDARPSAAFALLPGFACGSPSYYCLAAHWFAKARWQELAQFRRRTAKLGWYEYSRVAQSFRPRLTESGCSPKVCSQTAP